MKRKSAAMAAVVGIVLASGCNLSRRDQGVLVGAGTGAAAGGVIGKATGSTTRGAIMGAIVGGVAGGVIGHQMDQQAKELTYALPGASIERVGEGITVTFPDGLLFAFDSDDISPAARDNLTKFAVSLTKYPGTKSMIVGHTDGQGTAAYNQGLSERRARSAANYMFAQGIALSRLDTSGRGADEPVATNETEFGRKQNRRIEVAIFADESYRRQAQSRER